MERDSILGKIRALLSKTVANGCSENEALAALAKARAMMDAYEVTDEDLRLTKEEGAAIKGDDTRDLHDIRRFLATSVAEFTDTRAWRGQAGIVFCGTPADMDYAFYLLDALQTFILGELTNYLASHPAPGRMKRRVINGFVMGATSRIGERMREIIRASKAQHRASSTALVVAKQGLITDLLKQNGIILATRHTTRRTDDASKTAGRAAGDRASFGKPVSGDSTRAIA